MILVIDNYDSFTFNLVQYLGEMGCELKVFRNDAITIPEIEKLSPESIVISPGPGRPENAGIIIQMIQVLAGHFPILGVCLGHQAVGAAFGGQVVAAPSIMHGKTSEISHDGLTIFEGLPNPFTPNPYGTGHWMSEQMNSRVLMEATLSQRRLIPYSAGGASGGALTSLRFSGWNWKLLRASELKIRLRCRPSFLSRDPSF